MSFTGSSTPQSMSIAEAGVGTDVVQDGYGAFSANHSTGEAALLPALSRELPRAWRLTVKRLVDILLSTIALAALLPVLLVVGLAILLSEGRPIFFNWDVIGQDGRPFRGYKFRTMVVDAEAQRAALAASNEMRGPVFKMRNDPRVTRIGAVLRRYSIDELPQLWSVLKGDMSLVGPRPLGHGEYASATPYQRQKLSVTPGITCLWQVMGRSEITDFDKWVALDLKYIHEWSLLLDLKILARTIPAVVVRKGAW